MELKLDKYHVITNNKSLRIIAQDGRGEILNYPRYAASSYPEVEAKVGFTREDAEFFRTIVERLEEREKRSERERSPQSDRHQAMEVEPDWVVEPYLVVEPARETPKSERGREFGR